MENNKELIESLTKEVIKDLSNNLCSKGIHMVQEDLKLCIFCFKGFGGGGGGSLIAPKISTTTEESDYPQVLNV